MNASHRFALTLATQTHHAQVAEPLATPTAAVQIDGTTFDVMTLGQGRYLVRQLGNASATQTPVTQTLVTLDDPRHPRQASVAGESMALELRDVQELALERALSNGPSTSKDGVVKSPMPGRVVRVLVKAEQSVVVGEAVVIVEAMKMENEVRAPRAGRISRIAVRDGDAVDAGTVLIEIAPEG